jgi:hypothetical protein
VKLDIDVSSVGIFSDDCLVRFRLGGSRGTFFRRNLERILFCKRTGSVAASARHDAQEAKAGTENIINEPF